MSIIQEALKKAQNYIDNQKSSQKERAEEAIHAEKETPQQRIATTYKKSFKSTPLLLIVFIILAAFAAKQFLLPVVKTRLGNRVKTGSGDMISHQDITYKPIVPAETEPRAPYANPTTPSAEVRKNVRPTPDFVLNGIMYLNDGPQAVINGSRVTEGDKVNGAKVVKINKNNVVLNFDDFEITLNLKE